MKEKLLKNINIKLSPQNYYFPPQWLVLGVNNVCNLHCKMCDVGTQNLESNFAQNLVGTSPLNMPVELFKKIIDQTARYYPKTKIGYAFTEPLVYPYLEETLLYAKSKNLTTSITTNALTLKQKAKKLVDGGLTDLYISLDGPQEIHNKIRGHKASFQKAVEGIEAILELNPAQNISVFCVITEWNIGHLKEMLDFFKSYKLKEVGFMHTNFTSQKTADFHNEKWSHIYRATASNMDEINIDNYDFEVLWNEILEIKRETYPFKVGFSPEIKTKEKLLEFYLNPEIKIGKLCNDVFNNIMIKSDGSVIPAHGRCYNLLLGNIYESSLKEIWNSAVLKQFRKDLIANDGLLPACSRCCSAF